MNMQACETSVPAEPFAATAGETSPFAPLNDLLEMYFYKPDLQATRIVLGTIKAHHLNIGDPAWLFVVAPPGSGKTTMSIAGACDLPEVIALSDLTENTFLSGFYGHHEPGLLEKLGSTTRDGNTHITQGNAVFLAKDFTTVLSMRREKRSVILGQLREIHDGEWKRDFGTGETKIWRGRVTIIAAVTPVLDRYYSIFTVLGERFLQVRWHRPDSEDAGEWAIQQQGMEDKIKAEVREAISQLFSKSAQSPPTLPGRMVSRIAGLGEVVACARTHVFRSGYGGREIEYIPEPEANTRISKGLAAIARGIAALNSHGQVSEQDLQDSLRVGLDCITENRRKLLIAAAKRETLDSVALPRTVKDRQVEELQELGVLEKDLRDPRLSEYAARLLATSGVDLP